MHVSRFHSYGWQLVDAVTGAMLPRAVIEYLVADTSGALLWRTCSDDVAWAGGSPHSVGRALPGVEVTHDSSFRYGVCVAGSEALFSVFRFDGGA